ncbi:MAG: hypothetical protein LIP03_15365 [Bacteroidales bacterium]|nr:hypothetical protein [Bacteroidales bacterium]
MESNSMTERQSLDIITNMIQASKQRLTVTNGNIFLFWGWLCVAVCLLVTLLLYFFNHPAMNFFFFLIWVVGGAYTERVRRRVAERGQVVTYTDRLSNAIWAMVGWSALIATFMCLGFFLFGGKDVWIMMFLFAFIVVGIGAFVQGTVIQEKCMMLGGAFSMVAGAFITGCLLSGIPLSIYWVYPLFALSFALMFIVPGYIIRNKALRYERA